MNQHPVHEAGTPCVPLSRATVGAVVRGGKVVDAAPYVNNRKVSWVGRDVDDLVKELQQKRVGVRWIPE